MTTDTGSPWFPLFEFQDWVYQSFLVLPIPEEIAAAPGGAVTARTWAKGAFRCGQAFTSGSDGYDLSGILSFAPGIELYVTVKGILGKGDAPATFEATGTGMDGPTKGAVYTLLGWVFPEAPGQAGASRVLSVRGAVRAVRGPDARPETELGKMPVGTVGAFVITRAQ